MSFQVVVPQSIFGGWAFSIGRLDVRFLYHSLQCDQRWLFLFSWQMPRGVDDIRFGYRTRGDATPSMMTYRDGGWHWPWKHRFTSGRY